MKNVLPSRLLTVVLLLLVLAIASNASSYTIEVASVAENGNFSYGAGRNGEPANYSTSMSNDGNIFVFTSQSSTFALEKNPGAHANLVYRDIKNKKSVSIDISKQYPNTPPWDASFAEVSGDGKYIIFTAGITTDLYPNGSYSYNVYLYDIVNDTTLLIKEKTRNISAVDINYDGQYSVFYEKDDVKLYDRILNEVTSIFHEDNVTYTRDGKVIGISDSGDVITFSTKYSGDVYAYNRENNTLKLLTKTIGDVKQNGASFGGILSANGKFALLFSQSTNLVISPSGTSLPTLLPGPYYHVYVYDLENDTLTVANFTDNGAPSYTFAFFPGTFKAGISNDGRYIGAIIGFNRVIGLLDRSTGITRYFPMSNGFPLRGPVGAITPDGRYLSGWTKTPSINVFSAVRIDTQDISSFSVDAGLDQTIEQMALYGAYVTLTGELSAGTCTGEQIYRWSWPGGEAIGTNPTIFLPPGTTTVTLDWAGCGGTASDTVNVTVVDSTPPNLTVTGIYGTVGNAGWYRSNVSVELAAADNGSGVAAIYSYTANGVETMVAGTSASVPVSGDGSHTLTSWALDNDENRSTPPIVTSIQIDSIAPAITGAVLTQPNANGWYNTDISVHFSATDARSGIASVTPDTTLSTEGAGQSVTGTAFDVAGNSADYSVNGINLDRTPPLITITGVANGMTYNLGLVPQATFSASDSLSGLAGSTGIITGTPDAFGCGIFTYTVTATDNADNTATSSVTYGVKATPAGTSALIDELVNAGLLPAQTAETLQATLAKALSGYNSNPNLGDNMMNTFQNQINAALNSGKINAATAALLNNAANYIMLNN